MSKYVAFSGPYFPVFGLNTGKYRLEKTPYLDNFQAVYCDTFLTVDIDLSMKYDSSSINEVIRPVLFFFTIRFHKYKKAPKSTKNR